MTAAARLAALAVMAAAIPAGGCGARTVYPSQAPPTPQPAPFDLVVLLADDRQGTTGRAVVMTGSGAVELDAAGAWTRVGRGEAPAPAQRMSDEDVREKFGDLLATLPAPAATYTLYFAFDSEDLTAASRAQLPAILQAIQAMASPEVTIVGHTDRAGLVEGNVQLGLKRAQAVRDLLLRRQVAPRAIRVTSHGESDPLVATADDVFEPRNRRVDVTVR